MGHNEEMPEEEPKKVPVRRAAVDHHTDINLALMRRVQKVSVEIPFASQNYSRLQKVILSAKDYRHIVDEARGGVYGVASRPDLEVQTIEFPTQDDSQQPVRIPVLFNDSRQAYVLSARQEDELLVALHRHRPRLGEIHEAYIRAGDRKLNVLRSGKQRSWRIFVNIYMLPQLEEGERVEMAKERLQLFEGLDSAAALELERKEYGDDNDDDSTSDEEEKAVRKKVVKKRHHHGKHNKNANKK